ncbi:MAG: type ISP restriction/modification enzyme [Bacteroidales bacterium]
MTIQDYIDKLNTRFRTGISREHSYRGDLQFLLESIATDVLVTNEPARVACGAPDYIITKKNIPVGYIEAKDIGADLNSKSHKEQFERYRNSLNNLIITDYLTFQLFIDGVLVTTISIGQIQGNKIVGLTENYPGFIALIKDFCSFKGQTIKSASKLAKMMAGKARLLANVIEKALLPSETENEDEVNESNNSLRDQFISFQQILIHDITEKSFSDIYAQTIAYGMFAARLHDTSLNDFSRQEAAELIPKSNPFLRKLFQYIAGYDLDDRIKWIVDALADIFRACNVAELLQDFGKATQQSDPIIHFYETFLSEYDPALRKSRGVWYTPEPVVKFIVRAVDDILKTEFDLPQGIADTSKTRIKIKAFTKATADLRSKLKETENEIEVHKVQLLDPACGTGTFLAEVTKHIYKQFEGQQGIWNNYVEEHLIPRLNGFELLMASYAMAHLKLDLLLKETGYNAKKEQRFKIFLTNSLEEHHHDTGTLFSNWLSTEANEANYVKRDTPVMVVLGNPPYSVSSSNKSAWIQNLISDYKKDLNERKINLDDDYIKFIRFGQYFIDKNESGILAYISNNSFLDGITHRQMRKHLLESFDKIYIFDLHGNARKMDVCPDGSPDQNVFDIMAGVSINIFIKTNKKKKNELGQVFHSDLQGKREFKYERLNESIFKNINWKQLKSEKPNLFFVPKNFDEIKVYEKGFKLDEIYNLNNSGFETAKDSFIIKDNLKEIENLKIDIQKFTIEELVLKYNLKKEKAIEVKNDIENAKFVTVLYRPFDYKFTLISKNSQGVMFRPRYDTMKHINKVNPSLLCCKRQTSFDFQHSFITNKFVERCSVSLQTGEVSYVFPLYLNANDQLSLEETTQRTPNFNARIVKQIEEKLGLSFTNEKELSDSIFAPIDILDYIYAVLHSPGYREKYKEFLKIDFPRIPYPKDVETFWELVKFGGKLRQIHLLESPIVEKRITTYPISGNNAVEKTRFELNEGSITGKVWINDDQYFDNVPQIAWEFYIGGYQPAQKWLKDRKGRELSFVDIVHYQKIIVALSETDRLMKEIDGIGIE